MDSSSLCHQDQFGQNDVLFAHWLAREVGVAAAPGSSFFHEPEPRFIRFHFAKREETLRAAGERLLELRDRATGSFSKSQAARDLEIAR